MLRATTIGVFAAVILAGPALAQSTGGQSDKSGYSTGRQQAPETKGQLQPQGWTGELETDGAKNPPAASPQGQGPGNMQAAPEGSSKTIVGPDKSAK
jgi:hypothetical protein